MIGTAILLSAAGVASLLWASRSGPLLPLPFSARHSQLKAWQRRFPDAPREAVADFLAVFCAAFALRHYEKELLSPDDRVLGIHRALYPGERSADSPELAELAISLRQRYGLTVGERWGEDVTLAGLFEQTGPGGVRGQLARSA
ncbi:hypothetical protein [Rugamonas apoptosis]|uniref:Uncharacterized protein n=1 Tax=Rugamonas apoptosis TaxID=2758570 RepID=A0A7W2FF72_9BURK|nr:hypothetical protein [Rugamonas apoptosis]MBA5690524.1 hypothetical protein [Rugamonas apoptosis]